ncbi:MAG: hypothetical protein KAS32_31505 [Candidatus Peribacteraceae bacterium]|nr:hypothetical protein [Candidatus Peribacteraceae bacterium]
MAIFRHLGYGIAQCVDGKYPGCHSKWRIRVDKPIYCPRCKKQFENNKTVEVR